MKMFKAGNIEVVACILMGALFLGVVCIIESLRKD